MFTIKCVILYMMKKVSHNVEGLAGLQNCMDILKSEPDSSTGTCQMSSDDGNEFVGIKVEDATDIKEEEDPWSATSTGIKDPWPAASTGIKDPWSAKSAGIKDPCPATSTGIKDPWQATSTGIKDPWPATSTGIKTEPAVSCMSLFIQVYADWTGYSTICI
jgi:hypothetical protein